MRRLYLEQLPDRILPCCPVGPVNPVYGAKTVEEFVAPLDKAETSLETVGKDIPPPSVPASATPDQLDELRFALQGLYKDLQAQLVSRTLNWQLARDAFGALDARTTPDDVFLAAKLRAWRAKGELYQTELLVRKLGDLLAADQIAQDDAAFTTAVTQLSADWSGRWSSILGYNNNERSVMTDRSRTPDVRARAETNLAEGIGWGHVQLRANTELARVLYGVFGF